jgi:hypothetical protein
LNNKREVEVKFPLLNKKVMKGFPGGEMSDMGWWSNLRVKDKRE